MPPGGAANRTLLQGAQGQTEHQDPRRHEPQRPAHSNALIAMHLFKYVQLSARFGWNQSDLAALLRPQSLVYLATSSLDRSALSASTPTRCRDDILPSAMPTMYFRHLFTPAFREVK